MPSSRREVEVAVQDSIRAREDRERRILEARPTRTTSCRGRAARPTRRRQDAEAYREQVVADAEGEADRFTQILAEYQKAPGVTRERMYIETLEEVLAHARRRCSSTRKAATTCCTCRSISSSQRRSTAPTAEPQVHERCAAADAPAPPCARASATAR